MVRLLPAALVVALAGCGSPATPPPIATGEGLAPGSPAIVVATESTARNDAGSRVEGGKVFMMFGSRDVPFGKVPEGTRAIVLEDAHPDWGESRSIRVRIDEGEFAGSVGAIARSCLVEARPAR